MDEYLMTVPDLHARLEEIIRRMQKIQRSIRASRQPASRLELMELRDLGVEYACIIEHLTDSPDAVPDSSTRISRKTT
jgi:hypothetical protein